MTECLKTHHHASDQCGHKLLWDAILFFNYKSVSVVVLPTQPAMKRLKRLNLNGYMVKNPYFKGIPVLLGIPTLPSVSDLSHHFNMAFSLQIVWFPPNNATLWFWGTLASSFLIKWALSKSVNCGMEQTLTDSHSKAQVTSGTHQAQNWQHQKLKQLSENIWTFSEKNSQPTHSAQQLIPLNVCSFICSTTDTKIKHRFL